MTKLAIFASGTGTNARRLMEYFAHHETIEVCVLLSNKKDAGALSQAAQMSVPSKVFNRREFYESDAVPEFLKSKEIDLVILAGFLWLIPGNMLRAFPGHIINIHPALLPAYGGKGMYGANVHRAVIESGEKESGITIHYVNGDYDKGDIIFQARCGVDESDTPETLAAKIHELEYLYFPQVIERLADGHCY